jgi:type IV secretion system protein VirB2
METKLFHARPVPIRNASFQKTPNNSVVIAWKHQVGPKKSWTRRRIRANLLGMTCLQQVEPKKPEVPMNISSAWRRHFRLLPVSKIAFLLFPLMPVAAHALAVGGSPFDTGFSAMQNLFTGTVAKVASLIAIVIGGYQFAHGEPGAKKTLAGVAAGSGIAVLAANVLSWLWGI